MTTEHPPVAPRSEADSDAAATAPAAEPGPATGTPSQPGPSSHAHQPGSAQQPTDEYGGAPHGFFAWLRGLGLQRQPGWIGGVCMGIAARIGIDPIIVRGIFLVLALFAPPVIIFYGVAWLLLPDTDGRIQMQRLLRGDPQPALAGIAILIFVGLALPLSSAAQLLTGINVFSLGGAFFWGWPGSSAIGVLFNLALLAGVGALVFWLVRRNRKDSRSGGAASASRMAFASPTAAPSTNGGGVGSGDPDAAARPTGHPAAHLAARQAAREAAHPSTASAVADTAPTAGEPVNPGAGASVDEMAAWKLQHEAWRTERERFNKEQSEANRAARAQWAAENKARSLQFAAQASEHRRARKLERPRASAAAVFFTLGLALVAGAGSAITALASAENADYAATIGVLVAALVAAIAMVVAGAMRRRSGFLAFIAMLLLLIGVGTAMLPRQTQLLAPWSWVNNTQQLGTMTQPWGDLVVWVHNQSNDAAAAPRNLVLTKATGDVHIYVDRGSSLVLRAELEQGRRVHLLQQSYDTGDIVDAPTPRPNAGGDYTVRVGSFAGGPVADLTLDATLTSGSIFITEYTD
ncbi:PspC domain-containing protein [Microterricola viridarii]|uniref:Phage shock protein PspC (Stress-responsive transcriptional regulator) n=1 Tax=Microterricola viridarii TaxID=412690 RepID=A0A1H1LB41_9MICO|nr:PspC domain-containing protein [Microterricola viridarii]SDR71801.1 Phage shock protein PspC (stress-responsive transcriptional regulator) [Microterricola viridarii]